MTDDIDKSLQGNLADLVETCTNESPQSQSVETHVVNGSSTPGESTPTSSLSATNTRNKARNGMGDSRTWFQMQRLRGKAYCSSILNEDVENFQSVHLDFWDPDAIPHEFALAACSLRKIARGSSIAFGRP